MRSASLQVHEWVLLGAIDPESAGWGSSTGRRMKYRERSRICVMVAFRAAIEREAVGGLRVGGTGCEDVDGVLGMAGTGGKG